jgi:metal-dependent amidase/aminoacylase/carboxypeptidase family protein
MSLLDQALFEQMVEVRRDLHRHPELSWKEARTTSRICAFLEELGIEYREGIAGTGVFAEMPAHGKPSTGKTNALSAASITRHNI